MEHKELALLLMAAVKSGAKNACPVSPDQATALTKAEAYRRFGRGNVDRWIREGMIVLISANGKISKKCIDKDQLVAVAAASNRMSYLPVKER